MQAHDWHFRSQHVWIVCWDLRSGPVRRCSGLEFVRDCDGGHSYVTFQQGISHPFTRSIVEQNRHRIVLLCPRAPLNVRAHRPPLSQGGKSPGGESRRPVAAARVDLRRASFHSSRQPQRKELQFDRDLLGTIAVNSCSRHFREVAIVDKPRSRCRNFPEMRTHRRALAVHLLLLLCSVPFAKVCNVGCDVDMGRVRGDDGGVSTHSAVSSAPRPPAFPRSLRYPRP